MFPFLYNYSALLEQRHVDRINKHVALASDMVCEHGYDIKL